MQMKKILSLLLALALVISTAAIATAESTGTTQDTQAADETTATAVYTLDEMLTQAMTDAYQRQAAYAAYAVAFPDSRSIAGVSMDTQIVLLEMLLKANGVALPANDANVTAPETVEEAYAALAEAEQNALAMYKSYLAQETLAPDATIVFNSVYRMVRNNAATFEMKVRVAQRAEKIQELFNSDNAQVYVVNNSHGRGVQVIYVVNGDQTTGDDTTTDAVDSTTEDSMSN